MMKLNILGIFLALFIFSSCTKDEVQSQDNENSVVSISNNYKNSSKIISPQGYILSESKSDLIEEIFGKDAILTHSIEKIQFYDTKSNTGAVAIIDYVEGGVNKNIGFIKGDIQANYNPINTTFTKIPSSNGINSTSFQCRGAGCCYTSASTSDNGETYNFACKCEGNPNGNSSCSLTVTQKDKSLKQN